MGNLWVADDCMEMRWCHELDGVSLLINPLTTRYFIEAIPMEKHEALVQPPLLTLVAHSTAALREAFRSST